MKKALLGLLFAIPLFFISSSTVDAFSCSSNGTGGGNFNVAGTWTSCNSTTPQTTDSITINSGDTVTLVATTTVAGITINSGGIFSANTRTLTSTDGYTNNGSHTGTTSAMTLSGISGSIITGNGSYTPTGIVTISTGDKTVASGSNLSFPSVTVTGVILTNNSTAGLSVTTALSGTGTLTQGTSAILNLGGTSGITTLTATASTNEVHYTSTTANQTVKSTTYHHLFIDKSGRVGTLGGVITVNGNLSVTAGTLADGGFQITGNSGGTFSMSAGTSLTVGTTASATSFPTSFTNANITLNTTSTVNYNSNSAQSISNIPTYGNLTTTATGAVTKTAAGALTIAGLFTNGTNNTFADGGFTITAKDGATMTGSHTGSGKILFTGGSATHSVTGVGYNNVELDDSSGVLLSGTTTIGGTLTITSGTFDTDARTISVTGITTINGTLLISSITGTKTFGDITIATGATMNFTASEAVTINGNLTVNGTGVISGTSGVWTLQKVGGGTIGGTTTSLTILGSLTFATQYSISYPLTVNTFTVSTGVTETNTSTVTVNGTLGGAGTFTQNAGATLSARSITITTLNATASGNIVHFIGGVAGTIKGTSYVDMDINKSSGFAATANGTVNVAGNLTVTSGTISFASSTFTVTGTTDIYGTLTDTSGGGAGGNNVFNGLVTVHSGAVWLAIVGEVCDFHFGNGLVMNGSSFTSSTGIYYFETNNQSITGSSSFTIDNLSVSNIELTNSAPLTINTTLALGAGKIITGINKIILGASAAVSRTTGYVFGTIEKNFNSDTVFTFDIGDATSYSPVNLTLTGVTGTGSINASAANTDHTDITNSGIDSTKSVNRYWTLINNGLSFTNYNSVFNFVSGDVDSGTTVSDMTIAKKSSGSWSTISSSCAVTSCTATDLTSMSDFQIGIVTSSSTSTSTTSSTTSSESSSTSNSISTIQRGLVNLISQLPLPPSVTSPLFDILSTPLLLGAASAKIFPVAAGTFLIGSFGGFLIVVAKRRKRDRNSRVIRIS